MPERKSKYWNCRQRFREGLQDYQVHLKSQRYAPATTTSYLNYISEFFFYLNEKLLPETEVQYTDVLQYIDHCRKGGDTIRLINRKLVAVRKYYHYLQMQGGIEKNPATGLQLQGRRHGVTTGMLTMDQMEQLYDNYQVVDLRSKRNKVIISLLIYQGLTTEELGRLEPVHLSLTSGKIWIPGSRYSGSRTLELKARQVTILQEYLTMTRPRILASIKKKIQRPGRKAERPDWEQLENQLFISMNGSSNIKPSLYHLVRNLKKINPGVRSCRHIRQSVITHWLKNHDLREVQYMAGHKRISSTERYQVGHLEDLQEALKKYHPLR